MPSRLIPPNILNGTRHFHPSKVQFSRFHASAIRLADEATHYETLGVPHSATKAEIKRRFYELSKKHHPDLNRHDPHAPKRFVRISSAYAILGNPENKEKYDREIRRRVGGNAARGPSSAGGSPVGARPARGLSKRRTHFHGPPPSFYRNGGWATFKGSHNGPKPNTAGGNGAAAGFSKDSYMDDVPHFNFDLKYRQHRMQEQRWESRYRAPRVVDRDKGLIIPLVGVTMILIVAVSLGSYGQSKHDRK
ncbi:DnaJ-domain-containing protein [Choiromyces venosus 120613-1]|uniref:DnaJ-domain-containing protein n=1 Tax=Choiromyces venosus 120613-1 TaxID=1336337 RepID=A0A3N4J8A2_9PEZI|nr:DnaJ-domain-containing protein [Choiromyces venosus 120613-1]